MKISQRRERTTWRHSVLSLILGLATLGTAQAANYGLIMTIGNYSNPLANLPGIDLDARNAAKIAEMMGVPRSSLTYLTDNQLSVEGIRNAFAQVNALIGRGDNVFIYYSGHGTQSSAGGGKCTEGMVAYDMAAYRDTDLQQSLAQLSEKAGQLVMMNDSCFSGGQAESKDIRSMSGGRKPKLWKLSEAAPGYTCGEAINMKLTRTLVPMAAKAGSNLLYVAASRDNEVANASPDGSAATLAWKDCLSSRNDTDHSGLLTGNEIKVCAQRWLDQNNYNQHIALVGNKDLPLVFVGSGNMAGPSSGPVAGGRTLDDIRLAASPGIQVSLRVATPQMRVQQDELDFSVTSNQPGYLTILQVGSDGQTFNRLFPNDVDQNNYMPAGTIRLPRPSWRVRAGGPAGTTYLMALVSEVPRDFAKGMHTEGRFRSGEGPVGAKNLYSVATGAENGKPGRYGASEVTAIREY